MKDFRELLESDGVYVFDGAVGTRLYDKGVYINRSYDELNLAAPDLVREVHDEYVAAGAEVIETNTFGATRHKLLSYGLESKLRDINIAAVKIAREAAGERVFVAGAVGPLGLRIEPFGPRWRTRRIPPRTAQSWARWRVASTGYAICRRRCSARCSVATCSMSS